MLEQLSVVQRVNGANGSLGPVSARTEPLGPLRGASNGYAAHEDTVRVLICDSEPLIRAGLRANLHSASQCMEIVGEIDSKEAVDSVRRLAPDVVLMGCGLPLSDSAKLARQLTRPGHSMSMVVALIDKTDRAGFLDAVKAGVRGLINKDSSAPELVQAVRSVAGGMAFVSPVFAMQLLDWLANRLPDFAIGLKSANCLSDREREVLQLLGQGNSNAEIARKLRVSETTVRSHVYHILNKLHLNNRTEAVLFGFQYGMTAD